MNYIPPLSERSGRVEHWKSLVDDLFSKLQGQELSNSEGKIVKLNANGDTSKGKWLLTFEGYNPNENYIDLVVHYMPPEIIPQWAKLTDKDLKSKAIFEQVLKLFAQNLPPDFGYNAEIARKETKKQPLDIRERAVWKKISEEQAKQEILQNYLIQQRIAAGFNYIEVEYQSAYQVNVNCKRKPGEPFEFNVLFDY